MSSQASLLFALLSPLVSGRVFPRTAPTGTVRPYITYTRYGGDAPTFMENAVPSKENGTYQVEVWSDTLLSAETLIKSVESALVTATTLQARPLSAPADNFQDDMELYGFRQDFTIWSDR